MSSPRPILKRSSSDASHHRTHVVHFPPSNSLTRTYSAHSALAYDRSPIVVTPNSCALPERGCPGRTYGLEEPSSPSPIPRSTSRKGSPSNGGDLHPCAAAFKRLFYSSCSIPQSTVESEEELDIEDDDSELTPIRTLPALPPLIPDNSSESSEDSDGFAPSYASIPFPISNTSLSIPNLEWAKPPSFAPLGPLSSSNVYALSFLPHPPSPPYNKLTSTQADEESITLTPRPHRPRPERSRRERRLEGFSSSSNDDIETSDSIAIGTTKSASATRKSRIGAKTAAMRKAMALTYSSSFSADDDGCLGGF